MRQLISRAMHQPDDLVVEFDYCDAKGRENSPRRQSHPVSGPEPFSGVVLEPRRAPAVLPGTVPERTAGTGGGRFDAGGDGGVNTAITTCVAPGFGRENLHTSRWAGGRLRDDSIRTATLDSSSRHTSHRSRREVARASPREIRHVQHAVGRIQVVVRLAARPDSKERRDFAAVEIDPGRIAAVARGHQIRAGTHVRTTPARPL